MKDAYKQGRLVLLENLDPSLTSSEVQVIIIPKPAFSDYGENYNENYHSVIWPTTLPVC
jgi:hypothetical protein